MTPSHAKVLRLFRLTKAGTDHMRLDSFIEHQAIPANQVRDIVMQLSEKGYIKIAYTKAHVKLLEMGDRPS